MDTSPTVSPASPARFALLLAILGALALSCFGLRTLSTSALWMHLASGRLISQEGIATHDPFSFTTDADRLWINPHWLYDLSLFKLWSLGGSTLTIITHTALVLAAFLLALTARRARFNAHTAALVMLICGWLMAPVFQPGPLLPALAMTGLSIFILERNGGRMASWICLIPLQLIWTNVHGSFVLGPLLAAVYALQAFQAARQAGGEKSSATRSLLLLALALAALTLINPYGFGLHRQVTATVTNPTLAVLIEWISPFHSEFDPSWLRFASTVMLILVAVGFIFVRERLPIALTVLAVIGAFLLVMSARFLVISALLAAPFAVISLESSLYRLRRKGEDMDLSPGELGRVGQGLLIAACLLTLFYVGTNRYYVRTGSASAFGTGIASELLPTAACERVIGRPDFPKRAINLAMDGGYLAWTLPQHKVFTDTRVPVYGATFYQGLARALLGQPESWSNLVSRFEPGAVILNCSWPGAGSALRRLVDEGRWALVYFDGISAITVQRTTEHKALISDLEAQRDGLGDLERARQLMETKPSGLVLQPNSPRLIGAGAVYLALWRFKEAEVIHKNLTRLTPSYITGWLNLGISAFQLRHLNEAITALNYARKRRPDSALTWLWLGKAYEGNNMPRESAAALSKARSINPAMAESFDKGTTTNSMPVPVGGDQSSVIRDPN